MRELVKKFGIIAGILFALLVISRAVRGNIFTAEIRLPSAPESAQNLQITTEDGEHIQILEQSLEGRRLRIRLRPQNPGTSAIIVTDPDNPDFFAMDLVRVGRTGIMYQEGTGEFNGDRFLFVCAVVFLFSVAFLFLDYFRRAGGTALYSYQTLHAVSFGIFTMAAAVILLLSLVDLFRHPDEQTMRTVYSSLTGAAANFMMITAPFAILFAAAMTISNISLIRHEGRRFRNMLGILIGLLMVGGEWLGWRLNYYTMGSQREMLIHDTLYSVYCTAFVFFECILIGSIICGVRAARFRPKPDKDYIVILGCKIFGNGTLTPLLRGRVDRAIRFAKEQEQATRRRAIFVPSGGKGADEVKSEAEAMTDYLLSQGIEKEQILPENQSRNTYENMKFSGKLIRERQPEANVCFSTTNYHVFRSGLWAQLAGLNAEGMGARTKWYFWPNAFMREVVGLLANHIKSEIVLLVLFIAFYAVLTLMLN